MVRKLLKIVSVLFIIAVIVMLTVSYTHLVPLAFVFCAAVFFFGSALFFAPSFSALRFLFAWRWERIASICAIVDLELMMTGMTIGLRWVLL